CPWPRIQGAMFDRDSLLITYHDRRGEPRGPHKKGQPWEGRGDCIDCKACVAVCPMGIDIRDGSQLECIQCALCIDACNDIMKKVGRPKNLITYDTFRNLDAVEHGQRARLQLIRPRTILYTALMAVVGVIMLAALSQRALLEVNVLADRNPLFVTLSDGSVRNGYTVKILNKRYETRHFLLRVEGLPGASVRVLEFEAANASIDVVPDDLRALKVYVTVPPVEAAKLKRGSTSFSFVVRDKDLGAETRRATTFRSPER
ncbi:MAG: cytochrome c oxidase accessory protein CcoG, partial [Hyphomicrobiaceae bacterium]|nr:cytochrome c oxidase accessory protein CcoG [Hyphomicrobiaceae bacterium]